MKTRKCPVCDWEIEGNGKTVKLEGTNVLVCCDECAEKVRSNPGKYPQKEGAE
jgi:ribosome-binding protein aMBF1 (putative translation factor)